MNDERPAPATGSGHITAPVSRHLAVVDVARSIAFYRDVVGFTVQRVIPTRDEPAEVTLGPARITVGAREPDATAEPAILFFPTDDVHAMHARLATSGASPTTPANVNWIKLRLFEVRDPDGNVLWFGRSFDEPNERPTQRKALRKVMPELPLSDVPAGVAHYRDVLGFTINYQQHDIGVMDRDGQRLLLVARTERHTGIGSCCFYVTDADALHAELTASGANVQGEPVSQPWGLREFTVLDLEGNRLSFAQTFE